MKCLLPRSPLAVCLVAVAAVASAVLGMPSEVLGQQPTPRKPPVRKAPAKSAAPATAQPQYKGIFEPVSYPEDIKLQDVFFVSEDEGWVSGDAGTILHTTDAGKTWTPQIGGDPQSHENPVRTLQFLDAKHGWAALSGKLLRTRDGGENWEAVNPKWSGHYSRFVFTSPTDGVFIYGNEIHRSQDGGKSWRKVFTCTVRVQMQGMTQNAGCPLEELHFPTPSVGYALSREVGDGLWAVAKTEDGGQTWEAWVVEGEVGAKDGSAVFFDDQTGYGVLYGRKLHRTTDGGKTWVGVPGTIGNVIKFADPEVGWAPYMSNGHHLAWTTDGGKRWLSRPVALPASTYINGFSLPRRDRAYVVGDHGMIYRYRVVPVTEQVAANAIPAPAMPGIQTALDDQVSQLQQQLQSLEQAIEKKTGQQLEITGATEDNQPQEAAAPAEAGAAAEEGPGLAEQAAAGELTAIESTVENISTEVPKFSGKYRNLNLIFTGLQMVGQLLGQAQGMKESFQQLRSARDLASVSAALNQLTSQTQTMAQSAKSAFQAPSQ